MSSVADRASGSSVNFNDNTHANVFWCKMSTKYIASTV